MSAQSHLSDRLSAIAPSATLAVTARAAELRAAGEPVIGFGAGEPDFATPDYIVEAAAAACRDAANHKYTAGAGLASLREAIAAKTLRDSGYEVDPANIVVTNGGKQAVFQAFHALLNPGDEAILPTPYWTSYIEIINLTGARAVEVFAGADQDYKVTVDQLEAARTDRTKCLLFCSPSNPTGSVYTRDEVRAIGQWCLEHGIWVLTDEIYEHLLYDDAEAAHIVAEVPELADQTIVLNGVAKTYAMTGWRVGWMIGPAPAIKLAKNFQSHLCSNVCNVAQQAALAAVSGPLDAVYEMREAFDRRRKTMVKMLAGIDGLSVPTPKGAFYVYADCQDLLGRDINGTVCHTSQELATLLLNEAKVAVVPGEAFGPSGYFRLSYALGDDDLATGCERIADLLQQAR
ncbi:pyridoxal phosphate-dependent aminotransferase [Nanchangia anserum]|uniref:Aminotransferase n=1 Tax=Nanchangia anserum TaxID=2692125 RepID=A0A8I0GBM7_9ACTO|nr:pyridoxal phosphate-dependent aminotransferase [Nanchangia anserum]MBD3689311.1 pyridoxal phosphate-dependent aminotransferase [Nanchangia anserum]QOX81526.1 pyridoxal phosphate-dependent aminotransferase [Nanchangia anserum]